MEVVKDSCLSRQHSYGASTAQMAAKQLIRKMCSAAGSAVPSALDLQQRALSVSTVESRQNAMPQAVGALSMQWTVIC